MPNRVSCVQWLVRSRLGVLVARALLPAKSRLLPVSIQLNRAAYDLLPGKNRARFASLDGRGGRPHTILSGTIFPSSSIPATGLDSKA
jgi:hypothetical protein